LNYKNQRDEFDLDQPQPDSDRRWTHYLRGVIMILQAGGIDLPGADLVIEGDVPAGAGLSSSAAIEVAVAATFQALAGSTLSGVDLAVICQRAENEIVGVKSGIMDQFISALGKKDHALLIDCRSLEYKNIPLPKGAAIVICNTMKKRGLVDSEYNTRRAECDAAANFFGVDLLRDVSLKIFEERKANLDPQAAKRARHVISENERVLAAVEAGRDNDLATFGRLMNESHASLRDDFQVSCAELDTMVSIAQNQSGCYGARLTGAGFGGCTVNLVAQERVESFAQDVSMQYAKAFKVKPEIYICSPSDGASVEFLKR
jgi:galactokinase